MKITLIGRKETDPKNGQVKKLAEKLAKRGHTVFVFGKNNFISISQILFQEYDVVHFASAEKNVWNFLLKFLKRKTAFINASIPDAVETYPASAREYLAKWNLQSGSYILYFGRIVRAKEIHTLVEAFKLVEDKHMSRGKKLVIASEGESPIEYMNMLKDSARGRENIIFADTLEEKEKAQIFSHAYFFVEPSKTKNASCAILDALGYARAILTSGNERNRKLIGENVALFFRFGNPLSLGEKMTKLINDPSLVKAMEEASAEKARTDFSWDNIVLEIEKTYLDAMEKKNKVNFNSQINAKNI